MSGIMDTNNQFLIRQNLYSKQLKSLLLDELIAMKFVRILSDFPDGYTFNIPSLGEAETHDFNEGQAITYNSLDQGNFTFSFDQYKYTAISISEKFKRDSFWSPEVIASFVPKQHRALMEDVEARIWAVANSGQTASSLNTINGASHRWVASGSPATLAFNDFAKALYALTRANVPLNNLCAVVDPSVAYTIATNTNVTNLLSPIPQWGNIAANGVMSGFRFMFNVYGFDIYVSNYLPSGISETINSVSVTNGVTNYFFSATPGDTLPWIGAFRQHPTVYMDFNKDLQQTEYATFCEYGFKLYRPENLVTVLTSTAAVPA
jgi:hypothetical protein